MQEKGFTTELKLCDLVVDRWPYEDAKFENTMACGIFHFFEKLDTFFKESSRVMKIGGTFSFTVMVSENGLLNYTDTDSGLSIYYHNDFQITELINKHGFEILKCVMFLCIKHPIKKESQCLEGISQKRFENYS